MRPVNLIPPEARRGEKGPMRTGALSYVIVALLAAALLGVTGVVLTNNQISDRKAEKSGLESQLAEAEAQAKRVSSFANFASMQQAREQTVDTLARSRFDWERVLRELAIVIPGDVWLTNVTATVSPAVQISDSDSSSSSSSGSGAASLESVQGPSLRIEGCGAGHEAVARFLAALRDIGGVTRVSVLSSDRPDPDSSTGGGGGSSGAAGDCATRDFISKFAIVAAFDAVPLPASAGATETAPATSEPAASESTASAADQGQVSDGQQQLEQQRESATQQTEEAGKDVSTYIPGTATAP